MAMSGMMDSPGSMAAAPPTIHNLAIPPSFLHAIVADISDKIL